MCLPETLRKRAQLIRLMYNKAGRWKYMEELIELLTDIKDDVDFETCTTLIDDQILDSFDILQIISTLNENYDISIPASEIIPENFNSAQALYKMVQKLQEE